MYRRFHDRFGTAGLVVAVLALVVALAGTAFAAAGLNSKQKKEVTKIAKTYAGKPGATGAQGLPGANGTNGKDGAAGEQGPTGPTGTNGTNGKSVTTGNATVAECTEGGATVEVVGEPSTKKHICNGKEGEEGPEGPTGPEGALGTAGTTLPPNASETGYWSFSSTQEASPNVLSAFGSTEHNQAVPVSFPIPLGAAPTPIYVPAGNTTTAHCSEAPVSGTSSNPKAASGFLCVYAGSGAIHNAEPSPFVTGIFGGPFVDLGNGAVPASTMGTAMFMNVPAAGGTYGFGTWAVTG